MAPRTWISLAAAALLGACLAFLSLRPDEPDTPLPGAPTQPAPSGSAEDYAHTVRAYRIAAERPDLDRDAALLHGCRHPRSLRPNPRSPLMFAAASGSDQPRGT